MQAVTLLLQWGWAAPRQKILARSNFPPAKVRVARVYPSPVPFCSPPDFHIRDPYLVRSPSPDPASSEGSDVPPVRRSRRHDPCRYPGCYCNVRGLLHYAVLSRQASSKRWTILVSLFQVVFSEFVNSLFGVASSSSSSSLLWL